MAWLGGTEAIAEGILSTPCLRQEFTRVLRLSYGIRLGECEVVEKQQLAVRCGWTQVSDSRLIGASLPLSDCPCTVFFFAVKFTASVPE